MDFLLHISVIFSVLVNGCLYGFFSIAQEDLGNLIHYHLNYS